MPFKDYAVIALIALAAWVCWDWLDTRDELAAHDAKHAEVVKGLSDSLRAEHETVERQKAERESSQRALAIAAATARKAQTNYDQLKAERDALARSQAEVRAYLDSRMPDALYQRLRDQSARGGLPGQGDHHPARPQLHDAGTDAIAGRPDK